MIRGRKERRGLTAPPRVLNAEETIQATITVKEEAGSKDFKIELKF